MDACPRTIVLEAHQAALLKEIFDREVPYYTVEGGASLAELDPALEIDYRSLCVDTGQYVWQAVDHFENLQPGSLYIHSDAQPLGAFDPAYEEFRFVSKAGN